MALTKAEMAENLVKTLGIRKQDAKRLVEQLFETIKDQLTQGNEVKLSGFGAFEVRDKRQRPGRNPRTREEIPITARRVVIFRPGPKFRAQVRCADVREPDCLNGG